MDKVELLKRNIINMLYGNIDTNQWVSLKSILIESELDERLVVRTLLLLHRKQIIHLKNQYEVNDIGNTIHGKFMSFQDIDVLAKIQIDKGVEQYHSMFNQTPNAMSINIGNITGSNVNLSGNPTQSTSSNNANVIEANKKQTRNIIKIFITLIVTIIGGVVVAYLTDAFNWGN